MSVLAAIAGDQDAACVLPVGHELATHFETSLDVIHVSPARTQTTDNAVEDGASDTDSEAKATAQAAVEQYIDSDTAVTVIGRTGGTVEEILKAMDNGRPEYVVIGSRKRSPVGKAIFGTVTQSLLQESPLPVVGVPLDYPEQATKVSGPIVAAVDRSDRALAVVREASTLAKALNRPLHVVHVLPDKDFYDLEYGSIESTGQPLSMAELRSLAKEIADDVARSVDMEYTAIGLVGEPSLQITEYVENHGISYVVTSGRKRSPIGKVLFGSVTQSLLLNSSVPVVTSMGDNAR